MLPKKFMDISNLDHLPQSPALVAFPAFFIFANDSAVPNFFNVAFEQRKFNQYEDFNAIKNQFLMKNRNLSATSAFHNKKNDSAVYKITH